MPEREKGSNPNFLADGERLVFEKEIWIAKADGSDLRRVPGVPERYYRGDAQPFTMGIDGKDLRQVTQGEGAINTMPTCPQTAGVWSGGDTMEPSPCVPRPVGTAGF